MLRNSNPIFHRVGGAKDLMTKGLSDERAVQYNYEIITLIPVKKSKKQNK